MSAPGTTPFPADLVSRHLPVSTISRASDLRGRDLVTLAGISEPAVLELFETARTLKANRGPWPQSLAGRSAVLLFEKASLRTRMTFEIGIAKLGGHAIYMDHSQQRLGERESIRDYAKNLERWVDCIIARVYSQKLLEELAEASRVPVINALSDRFHPCQSLADLFTLWERPGGLRPNGERLRLAYIGDGNNVCHSLMQVSCLLGVDMTVVSTKGYEPQSDVLGECAALTIASGSTLRLSNDPAAVENHHAVYTDVWASMGQADQAGKRRKAFAKYQVNAELMAIASKGLGTASLFMHCLPAQRGVEVTDEVIDAPSAIVYDQAENRLHAQAAVLTHMLS
jgi:ornithine carbamoyltransferase